MVLVPRMIPMIDNPRVAVVPAARWRRARIFVLTAMVGLPLVLGLLCLAFALLPHLQISEVLWWSVIPVLVAAAADVSLVAWLRRDGLTDPASWFPATVLMTGTQAALRRGARFQHRRAHRDRYGRGGESVAGARIPEQFAA